jgi:hypothetical protein
MKRDIGKLLFISTILFGLSACKVRHYKPSVMPTGKGELTRKQIRRDFTTPNILLFTIKIIIFVLNIK